MTQQVPQENPTQLFSVPEWLRASTIKDQLKLAVGATAVVGALAGMHIAGDVSPRHDDPNPVSTIDQP